MTGLLDECKHEMQIIRDESINDCSVRYYDILKPKSLDHLSSFARNESIVREFEPEVINHKFPNYCKMLRRNLKKGTDRKVLIDKGRQVFCCMFDANGDKLPYLPPVCTDKILFYLTNYELRNLTAPELKFLY